MSVAETTVAGTTPAGTTVAGTAADAPAVAPTTTAQMVDQKAFRDVVGRFASGVTVITTSVDGQPFGTTASAMSSLSMDPPMLLVCLNKTSETGAAVLKGSRSRSTSWPTPRNTWPASSRSRARTSSPAWPYTPA